MSQTDSVRTSIDGLELEMRMLDPWTANEILHTLWKIVGPSIGDVIAAATSGGVNKAAIDQIRKDSSSILDRKLDGAMIGSAVSGLFSRMDAAQSRVIISALAEKTTCDGKRLSDVLLVVFAGKIGTMYKFAAWGLGVQFENFFGSIPSAIEWFVQRAAAVVDQAEALSSPST